MKQKPLAVTFAFVAAMALTGFTACGGKDAKQVKMEKLAKEYLRVNLGEDTLNSYDVQTIRFKEYRQPYFETPERKRIERMEDSLERERSLVILRSKSPSSLTTAETAHLQKIEKQLEALNKENQDNLKNYVGKQTGWEYYASLRKKTSNASTDSIAFLFDMDITKVEFAIPMN